MSIDIGPVIRRLLLAVPLFSTGCGNWADCDIPDEHCGPPLEKVVVVDPADQRFGPALESCVVDAKTCLDLCRLLHPPTAGTRIVSCQLLPPDDGPGDASSGGAPLDGGADAPPPGSRSVRIVYRSCPVCGRRPASLASRRSPVAVDTLTSYWAEVALLEGASIEAFRTLARELSTHGAPADLVGAARRAAADESRHFRLTGAIAKHHGSRPARPSAGQRQPVRSVEAIAAENVREGCVRETYGAASTGWQALRAADPVVRGVMASITVDEINHANLAFRVACWADGVLSAAARRRVATARAQAVDELGAELDVDVPAFALRAGLPDRRESLALFGGLKQALWS